MVAYRHDFDNVSLSSLVIRGKKLNPNEAKKIVISILIGIA